jgi:hypothetical protein
VSSRQTQADIGAAAGSVARRGAAAVRAGHGGDNCEADARSALSASGMTARETVEGSVDEFHRESRSLVANVDVYPGTVFSGRDAYISRSVAEGIVDEVVECLFESEAVGDQHHPRGDVNIDGTTQALGARGATHARHAHYAGQVKRLNDQLECAAVEPREEKQSFSQTRQPLDLVTRRAQGLLEVVCRVPALEGHLDFSSQQRQRGA